MAVNRIALYVLTGVGLCILPNQVKACPFCSAVSLTLAEEMASMDTVAIAKIVAGSETDADAEFEIMSVIHGERLVRSQQKLRVNYFGKAKPDQQFLLMGVDPPDLLWSSPLPVSDTVINYVKAIAELPKDSLERLQFFMHHFEHSESMIARDAYDEFAKAPYADLISLKDKFDRKQLINWIKDESLPSDRKRLYLVMLGICGQPADAELLEEMLKAGDDNLRACLDPMIACYITLKGDEGLKLINELYLANKKSQYADTYSAIMALRFHLTDAQVIKKEQVLSSLRLILDRPELADLVIPDLARWEDWSQIDKLAELFKSADDNSSWVRVPVINYLRACPLPEAEAQLQVLKDIDPAAFKRATSFFPVPKAASGSDGSSTNEPNKFRGLAASDAGTPTEPGQQWASAVTAATSDMVVAEPPQPTAAGANRSYAVGVVCMVSITMWLAMWLAISGAGSHGAVARLLCRLEVAAHSR